MKTQKELDNCKRLTLAIEYLRGHEDMDSIIKQIKKVLRNKLNRVNETIRDI